MTSLIKEFMTNHVLTIDINDTIFKAAEAITQDPNARWCAVVLKQGIHETCYRTGYPYYGRCEAVGSRDTRTNAYAVLRLQLARLNLVCPSALTEGNRLSLEMTTRCQVLSFCLKNAIVRSQASWVAAG